MRLRANVLLSLGTILATLGGARLPEVEWRLVAIGCLVLVAGGWMYRAAGRRERENASGADLDLLASLRRVVEELDALNEQAPSIDLAAIAERLEALDTGAMGQVGEAIPRQIAVLGGARFAEIFGAYSAGERLVHRAWSAAIDGHRPEALHALAEGSQRIRESLTLLEGTR